MSTTYRPEPCPTCHADWGPSRIPEDAGTDALTLNHHPHCPDFDATQITWDQLNTSLENLTAEVARRLVITPA